MNENPQEIYSEQAFQISLVIRDIGKTTKDYENCCCKYETEEERCFNINDDEKKVQILFYLTRNRNKINILLFKIPCTRNFEKKMKKIEKEKKVRKKS